MLISRCYEETADRRRDDWSLEQIVDCSDFLCSAAGVPAAMRLTGTGVCAKRRLEACGLLEPMAKYGMPRPPPSTLSGAVGRHDYSWSSRHWSHVEFASVMLTLRATADGLGGQSVGSRCGTARFRIAMSSIGSLNAESPTTTVGDKLPLKHSGRGAGVEARAETVSTTRWMHSSGRHCWLQSM